MKKIIILLGILACTISCKCTNEAPKEEAVEPETELVDSLEAAADSLGVVENQE